MSKRTPEEILKSIEDSDVDDEVDRILALSPEERRRNLEAAGVDIRKLHAQADALHNRIQQTSGGQAGKPTDGSETRTHANAGEERKAADASEQKAVLSGGGNGARVVKLPAPTRRLPRARWLALPAAAALTWGAVALMTGVESVGSGQPSPEDLAAAMTLREKARGECSANKWKACLSDLDAAKKLDPRGEDEAIERERAAAESALRGAP
jgi:hypothetical protein